MRKYLYLAAFLALALVVVAVCIFRPHPAPELPAKEVVTDYKTQVVSLPMKPGDPLTLRLLEPSSRWKAIVLAPTPLDKLEPMRLDMGLGYEMLTWDPHILPEMTLDALVTPNRYGIGGSLALSKHLDLEAGVSRRWDQEEIERYVGVGFKVMW